MTAASPTVRCELRPGDLGAIVAHHGAVYLPEFGLDSTFEAHVAASVAAVGGRGFPRAGEHLWIVERDGRHAGSLALSDEGDGTGMVRWFVLDRDLRGAGLGRRLLGELFDRAAETGYDRLILETFSDLRGAAHLYRERGFELRSEQTGSRWGRESLTYQRYELNFHSRAHSSSCASTGPSERPFSVSA